MIYLAVLGALACSFLGGFTAQWMFLRLTQPDQCQPALNQLKFSEDARTLMLDKFGTPDAAKKEARKAVRRQWSEDMPAKDAN